VGLRLGVVAEAAEEHVVRPLLAKLQRVVAALRAAGADHDLFLHAVDHVGERILAAFDMDAVGPARGRQSANRRLSPQRCLFLSERNDAFGEGLERRLARRSRGDFERRFADAVPAAIVASADPAALCDDEAAFQSFAERIVPLAQEKGIAAVIAGDSRIAGRVQADGIHVEGGKDALADMIGPHAGKDQWSAPAARRAATTRWSLASSGGLHVLRPLRLRHPAGGPQTQPWRSALVAEVIEIPCIVLAGSDVGIGRNGRPPPAQSLSPCRAPCSLTVSTLRGTRPRQPPARRNRARVFGVSRDNAPSPFTALSSRHWRQLRRQLPRADATPPAATDQTAPNPDRFGQLPDASNEPSTVAPEPEPVRQAARRRLWRLSARPLCHCLQSGACTRQERRSRRANAGRRDIGARARRAAQCD